MNKRIDSPMATCQHEQQLRFRWNDHVSHLSKLLSVQRQEESFCDVTLVSEDGYILKGHQAILSSTSGYFQRILKCVLPEQHPIIVLHGANHTELSCLMEYIYQGVTQVKHQSMESVIDVAEMLEIKGLSRMKSNSSLKKLIHSADVTPSSPQCFHPSPSRSPSPHYSTSPQTSSPAHYSFSKMAGETEVGGGEGEVLINLDNDCIEAQSGCSTTSERAMLTHISNLEYSNPPPQQDIPSHQESYSDQTSGIDLSISRGGNENCSSKDVLQESTLNDRMFKKRKLMEKINEELNDPLTDPDWGRISDNKDDQIPSKNRKFNKPKVPPIKRITSTGDSSGGKTSLFSLDNLAFLLPKQKHSSCSSPRQASSPDNDPSFNKKIEIPTENESDGDSQVEVSYGNGMVTLSISTCQTPNSSQEGQAKAALVNSDVNNSNSPQVTFSFSKTRKKTRTRRELEEKRKKWLAKEKAVLFGDLKRRPANKALRKLSWVGPQSSDASESCVGSKASYNEAPITSKETFPPLDKEPSHHCAEKNPSLQADKEQGDDFNTKTKNKKEVKKLKFPSISPLSLFTLPPTKERGKQTRNSLTLEERIKVIEAFLDGKSQRQIAHLYSIGKTQVNGIIKKREEILAIYRNSLMRGEKLTMKRQRKSEYASLNEHLIQWYRHMTLVAGMKITTGMLRSKALQIAPQLGYRDFKASNGWLATFKANNNLKFSKAKKHAQTYSNENYQDEDGHQDEEDFFEEGDAEESVDMGTMQNNSNPEVGGEGGGANHSAPSSHLISVRGEPHTDASLGGQNPGSNVPIGNTPALLSTGGPLGKVSQVSNMSISSNLAAAAYNLTRDHTRTEIGSGRGDISHLSDLHSSSAVNPSAIPHPPLSKTDAPLSYKNEDAISYGYDPQSRINEGTPRGSEYNYTHYSFPGTYYGYHFLGQY